MDDFHIRKPAGTDTGLPLIPKKPSSLNDLILRSSLRPEEEDANSESSVESTESATYNLVYPVINSAGQSAETVVLWCFLKHSHIALFPTGGSDLILRIITHAHNHMGYKKQKHKLTMLSPGQLDPVSIKSVYALQPGTVVMIFPRSNYRIYIEIRQLNSEFSLMTDPTSTVYKLKSQIKQRVGIPIDRQELLFNERSLENNHRLIEYQVTDGSILKVMIQVHFDLLVNIETFWGKTYRIYTDPCNTGIDILHTILSRTVSNAGMQESQILETYIPLHILILNYKSRLIMMDHVLAPLKIKCGESLSLTTVGHKYHTNFQSVSIVTETGETFEFTASKYDRWGIIAFMLHGLINVPVDLMRLYKENQQLNFMDMVGVLPHGTSIVMNIVMTQVDDDVMFGMPIKIDTGNGIIENVKVDTRKTMKTIKTKLELLGIPNAEKYELVLGNQKLLNSSIIKNVITDPKKPLALKLESFPLFVHAPNGVIHKTHVNVRHSIIYLKHKIQTKTGIDIQKSRLLVAGEELHEDDMTSLYDAGVSIKNSVFIQPANEFELFNIVSDTTVAQVRLPLKPVLSDIEIALQERTDIPYGSVDSLLTFMYWFYAPRLTNRHQFQHRKRIKKRIPKVKEILVVYETTRDLQDSYERGVIRARSISPNYALPMLPDVNTVNITAAPRVKHFIKTQKSKFEPNQFLDVIDDVSLSETFRPNFKQQYHKKVRRDHQYERRNIPNKSKSVVVKLPRLAHNTPKHSIHLSHEQPDSYQINPEVHIQQPENTQYNQQIHQMQPAIIHNNQSYQQQPVSSQNHQLQPQQPATFQNNQPYEQQPVIIQNQPYEQQSTNFLNQLFQQQPATFQYNQQFQQQQPATFQYNY